MKTFMKAIARLFEPLIKMIIYLLSGISFLTALSSCMILFLVVGFYYLLVNWFKYVVFGTKFNWDRWEDIVVYPFSLNVTVIEYLEGKLKQLKSFTKS